MRFNRVFAIHGLMLLLPLAGFAAPGDSRLAEAAKSQNGDAVRVLLRSHAEVNAPQPDGATALHWAAHWNDLETADALIRARANVNAADDLGVTPLLLACTNGSAAMVEKLLAAGARADTVASTGESALMTCARAGSVKGVQALLAAGANVNVKETLRDQTALMWAVAERHAEVVRVLIDHGADINARSRITRLLIMRETEEVTGSKFVCRPGDPPGSCANAETIEKGGSTPMLFAARTGDIDSTQLLLAAGANVNDAAPDGSSALVLAAYSGQGKLAAFLLNKGADPNSAGAGYTALHAAVLRDDSELVKALLAHRANPNAQLTKGTPVTREGQDFVMPGGLVGATPFFLAAKLIEVGIMKDLAAAGADPRLGLKDGTSPLMAATGIGWRNGYLRRGATSPAGTAPPIDDDQALAAVKLILDLGANVNASNRAGDTALHGAAASGYGEIIGVLAGKGANLEAKNRGGQTALAIVLEHKGNKGRHELKSAEIELRKLGARVPDADPKTVRGEIKTP
jgi:ankyrin repeat protein